MSHDELNRVAFPQIFVASACPSPGGKIAGPGSAVDADDANAATNQDTVSAQSSARLKRKDITAA
jgi:hypothetical protein